MVPPAALPAAMPDYGRPVTGWRLRLYTVIFEADTRAGRLFDLAVITAIVLSVLVVLADSVQALHQRYAGWFSAMEWAFTLLFTAEYLARLACVQRPWRYATSFFGVVDLLAVLPTYLALLVPVAGALIDVRILRLLRVFRILRLTRYVQEFSALGDALRASRRKILVFLSFVMMMVLVCGTVMYVVEGPANGYTSIPTSMYWAISTMTTVGFGDIAPKTDTGRAIASVMMLLGWGVLAVPTGSAGSVAMDMAGTEAWAIGGTARPSAPQLRPSSMGMRVGASVLSSCVGMALVNLYFSAQGSPT